MTAPMTGDARRRLVQRLTAAGCELTARANQPVALEGRDHAWLVLAGQVELFAVTRPDGRRTHLASLAGGDLMLGFGERRGAGGGRSPSGGRDLEPIAVGSWGTRLARIPLAELRAAAREEEGAPAAGELIDAWLDHLFERLPTGTPPKAFEALAAGSELLIERAETVARPVAGPVWVRHVTGRSRLLGEESLAVEPADYLLPVARAGWLVCDAGTRLSCVPTPLLLRSGGLWEGLERFHELFLGLVGLTLERAAEADRTRVRSRLELDRDVLAGASARLASVLGATARGPVDAGDREDPLLAVCRVVARGLGVTIRKPAETGDLPPFRRLARLGAASRIRHRRVILRDDWWRRDNGPLIAFRRVDDPRMLGTPVALLPLTPTRYELVDPAAGTRTPIDAAAAEGIHGIAFMLYPALPDRVARIRDVAGLAFRNRGRELGTLALVGAAGGLLALVVPMVTAQVVGRVIPSADRSQLVQLTLALVAAAVAAAAFQFTRGIAVLRLGGKIDGSAQAALWDRLLRLPASFFRRFTVGDLASRSMGLDRMRELLSGSVAMSLLSAVFSVFSFALLFYFSWRLALLATALVAILIAVTVLVVWLQLRYQRTLLELQGKIASMLFGFFHGVAKLRASGGERRAFALWAETFARQREVAMRARGTANLQTTFNAVYGVAATLALFAAAALALREELPLAEFLGFSAAYGQFQGAMLSSIEAISGLLTMVPLWERLRPILTTPPEVDESRAEAGELAGDVEFSHISFRYHRDGPSILQDVSFRAAPGEFIALVGPSGAGKSTCLRLLLGFEQPQSGSIYFDGTDLSSLDLRSVRRQIGVVLQGGQPLAGDVFHNIVGSSDLGLEDAWHAAEMAGLADDVRAMPMGMNTIVAEGGTTFSGGQRQRLLIARAVVHRPRIVLFDEATSALDNRTQETVRRSLERLKATRIVIAHRLSTIHRADRIYVLDGGRVVESGGFDELVARGGLFTRLVERQAPDRLQTADDGMR